MKINKQTYDTDAHELARLDPSNPELQTLTDPNQPRVIGDNDVSRMENALLEAREVNRLLTTPEGRKELLAKTPTGTENLTEAAKKVVEQEQLKGIDNSQNYSGAVSFGRNPNQEYHVWRHIEKETPLNKEEVKNEILEDLSKIKNIKDG
ncbi:hypothetical protein [Acetobacter fabarum]|uniref:hypothetical protein n=1 Tax=Acetobacter fabarum TaxID=483199 RepID=UPI0020A1FBAE|nr:hypothetical protein [Acetobacter fabarum]MCP1229352.1 hypothetical protein [Acetobacter fabarum]MCP1234867.1 hypothetical protein [Acetobacter fabarum]